MERDWMASIKDARRFNELTIPGTHDSATYHTSQFRMFGFIKTQTQDITQQLWSGCRFLDIRLRYYHGRLRAQHDRYFLHFHFDDIYDQCTRFLGKHPGECILMSIRREMPDEPAATGSDNFVDALAKFINRQYWYTDSDFPTLGAARGKIVLLRRYNVSAAIPMIGGMGGIDLTGIGDNTTNKFQIPATDQTLHYEDKYRLSSTKEKRTSLFDFFQKLDDKNIEEKNYFLAFTSGFVKNYLPCSTPRALSRRINPWFIDQIVRPHRPRAIIPMDFVTREHCKVLVEANGP